MKKLIVIGLLFSGMSSAFAFSCTDLKVNLKRGAESKDILALQQFLVEKKLLNAKPNGYFGPGTQKAVQAYQKSVGLTNSGSVLALTREKIRKESCGTSTQTTTKPITTPTSITTKATSTIPKTTTPEVSVIKGPAPIVSSVDKATILLNGKTDWEITIHGSNFSTTSNIVYLVKRDFSKRYTIGTLPSTDKKTIKMPKSIGLLTFPCGVNCRGSIGEGDYLVVVETKEGGESNANQYIGVRDSRITSNSSTVNTSIPYVATSTRLGTFVFNTNIPLTISAIKLNISPDIKTATNMANIIVKDEETGAIIPSSGSGLLLGQNDTKTLGVYADVQTTKAVSTVVSYTIDVIDTLSKKVTSFTTASSSLSFQGEPSWVTENREKDRTTAPNITKIDPAIIVSGGKASWSVSIIGDHFSTTTNTVYLKSRQAISRYTLGVFPSTKNGTVIELPSNLGSYLVSCGENCKDVLPPGDYDVTVVTKYGESLSRILSVGSFNITTVSGTANAPIVQTKKGALLGRITIGSGANVTLSSVRFTLNMGTNSQKVTITNTTYKDELAGQTTTGSNISMTSGETKVISVYADVVTKETTEGAGYFIVEVTEPNSKKITTFTTSIFPISFSMQ